MPTWKAISPKKGKNICTSWVVFFHYCCNVFLFVCFLFLLLYFLSTPHSDLGKLPETLVLLFAPLISAFIGLSSHLFQSCSSGLLIDHNILGTGLVFAYFYHCCSGGSCSHNHEDHSISLPFLFLSFYGSQEKNQNQF